MKYENIILWAILLILLYYLWNKHANEPYIGGIPSTIFPKKNIKIDVLEDPLFKDVIMIDNDEDPYIGMLGIDKCMERCNGNCVEYGITGQGLCFPAVKKL